MQKKMTFVDGDHPRVCGEHSPCAVACASCLGSSPRMRGTHGTNAVSHFFDRIIPAYAGNTRPVRFSIPIPGDHPRVCGEHLPTASVFHPLTGSSPRMRGTLLAMAFQPAFPGIIPAYAGNTSSLAWPRASSRDHPRVCGEHCPWIPPAGFSWGSSPRMRGTP